MSKFYIQLEICQLLQRYAHHYLTLSVMTDWLLWLIIFIAKTTSFSTLLEAFIVPSGTIKTSLHGGGIYVSYIEGSLSSEPEMHGAFSSRNLHTPLGIKKNIRNILYVLGVSWTILTKNKLVNEQEL